MPILRFRLGANYEYAELKMNVGCFVTVETRELGMKLVVITNKIYVALVLGRASRAEHGAAPVPCPSLDFLCFVDVQPQKWTGSLVSFL